MYLIRFRINDAIYFIARLTDLTFYLLVIHLNILIMVGDTRLERVSLRPKRSAIPNSANLRGIQYEDSYYLLSLSYLAASSGIEPE